jgi:predicted transcriptional regulator of viral defense system
LSAAESDARANAYGCLKISATCRFRRSHNRLTREGTLERLSNGVYYRARQTAFGKSLPSPTALQELASRRKTVYPAGIAAANLLGFTTQTARRSEVSTNALSLPRKLIGSETVVHTIDPAR